MTQRIVDQCIQYGTGRDTLRCLALGTIDNPPSPQGYQIYRDKFLLNFFYYFYFLFIDLFFVARN